MADRRGMRAGRPGRLVRVAERALLGLAFGVVVALLDRRLRAMLARSARRM